MFICKQIKVVFFIGVMGLTMLHNALPHVHHSHSHKSNHADKHIDHHSEIHANHHQGRDADHHSNEQARDLSDQLLTHHLGGLENEFKARGFLLSFLLNNHSHSFHTHEFLQLTKIGNQYSLDKHLPDGVALDHFRAFCENKNQYLHRFSLFKRPYYDDPLSLNSPLRGPPPSIA